MNFEIIQFVEHSISIVFCILYKIFKRKFVITLQSHLLVYIIQSKNDPLNKNREYRINVHDSCHSFIHILGVLIEKSVYRYKVYAQTCETDSFYHNERDDSVVAFIHHPTLFQIVLKTDELYIKDYKISRTLTHV